MLFVAAAGFTAALLVNCLALTLNQVDQPCWSRVALNDYINRNAIPKLPPEVSDVVRFVGWSMLICRFPQHRLQMGPQHVL